MEISASLDPAVGKNLEQYIEEINALDGVSFHLDIMDGNFVERKSVTLAEYERVLELVKHPVDVHVMASQIGEFVSASRTKLPRSITFHAEAVPMFLAPILVQGIRTLGVKPGLAIDFPTPVGSIDPKLIANCDTITIMSVKAGKSGQIFSQAALKKVGEVKRINPRARIIMDGGINSENFDAVKEAGVDTAVIGSYLYNAANKKETTKQLL